MMEIMIGRKFSFSAGHRLTLHEGKCRGFHGHNYEGEAVFAGRVDAKNHMLADFAFLKEILEEVLEKWDHSFIINEDRTSDQELKMLVGADQQGKDCFKVVSLLCEPTLEAIAWKLFTEIQLWMMRHHDRLEMQNGLRLARIRLFETGKCFAEVSEEGEY